MLEITRGGASSLLICAGSLTACLISNNNQNQIKTTSNTISNKQSTTTKTPYEIYDLSSVRSFFNCSDITSGTIYLTLYDNDDGTHTASFTCWDFTNDKQTLELSGSPNVTISDVCNVNGINYTITEIGENAFRDCSLLSLWPEGIPNSITSIEDYAFYGCTSLTSVTIPSSVSSIGQYAFGGCSSLWLFHLYWTAKQLNSSELQIDSTWLSGSSINTVYVPYGTSTDYETLVHETWGLTDAQIIEMPEPSSNSNIGLAIGLGIGLGVPAVGGIGFGIYYGVKRKKNKK